MSDQRNPEEVLKPGDEPLPSPEEELFCQAYSMLFKAGPAMREAKPHLTEGSAYSMGADLMKLQYIRDRIQGLIEARKRRLEIDGDLLLHEINLLANADMASILDENGFPSLAKIKAAPPEVTRCIESIKVGKDGITVKFHSKTKALELSGKAKRLFVDRTEVEGGGGGPVIMEHVFVKPGDKKN